MLQATRTLDGYPTSSPEDTTPAARPISLERADAVAEHDHTVTPDGSEPDGTVADEDNLREAAEQTAG